MTAFYACRKDKSALTLAHVTRRALVDGERSGLGEQERVAVRLRLGDGIAARVAAAARAVLDDDLLSEIVGELLRQNSRHHVDRSARRVRIDDANDTLGIGLRRRLNGEPEQP